MKNIRFCLSILFLSLIISCSNEETEPEKIRPIELSKRILCIDHTQTMDTIDILSGNGDYKITEISIGRNANEAINKKLDSIPLKDIFKIHIEGDKIIGERILLEDLFFCGGFVLVDAKGVRKTCDIQPHGTQGFTEVWPD